MFKRPRRIFWPTLFLSAAIHLTIWMCLGRGARVTPPGHRGVVSIDLVREVHHHDAAPRPSRARVVRLANETAPPTDSIAESPVSSNETRGAEAAGNASAFIGEITRVINARKSYPPVAVRRELEGRVMVALTLARDGSLLRAEIEEASDHAVLNRAALAAVRGAGRYPVVPADVAAPLHLHVPLIYKISRR